MALLPTPRATRSGNSAPVIGFPAARSHWPASWGAALTVGSAGPEARVVDNVGRGREDASRRGGRHRLHGLCPMAPGRRNSPRCGPAKPPRRPLPPGYPDTYLLGPPPPIAAIFAIPAAGEHRGTVLFTPAGGSDGAVGNPGRRPPGAVTGIGCRVDLLWTKHDSGFRGLMFWVQSVDNSKPERSGKSCPQLAPTPQVAFHEAFIGCFLLQDQPLG